LAAIWVAGMAAALASIIAGLVRVGWIGRRSRLAADGRVRRIAAQTMERLGVTRQVKVIEAAGQAMPMTWGVRRPVILLPVNAVEWSDDRLRAVLAHELAHVKRNDVLTQLVARMACALYWFHPLIWIAARRLREERELACDDMVLAAGSRASDYAQQLLDFARTLRPARFTAATSVAMARRSHLAGRLVAVLDSGRSRADVTRRLVLSAVAVAVLVVVPLASATTRAGAEPDESTALSERSERVAPGVSPVALAAPVTHAAIDQRAQGGCSWSSNEHSSSSTNIDDDHTRIRIEAGECRIDLSIDGEVEFTQDFTDVARLSSGGSFEIEEREGSARRRVMIASTRGALDRSWFVNGDEEAYGTAAREWVARTLLVVFRRTGLQAEERGTWILQTRGLRGLLTEIDSIGSDYTAGRYYEIALAQPDIPAETVRQIVENAGRRIHSDYTLGRMLRAVRPVYLENEAVRAAFVHAAGSMDSDYEKRRVLSAILSQERVSAELASAILEQAATLDSDYELSTLLRELIAAHPVEESMTPMFFRAVRSIESDYERRRVLTTLLESGAPSQAVLDQTLEAAQGIESDHELAELLLAVAQRYPLDQALPASYVRAAQTLGSDHEQGRVWGALVSRASLSPVTLTAVLDAASTIDSDHEQGQLLGAVLEHHGIAAAHRDAFFRAVDRIDSDFTRGEVLRKTLDQGPDDRATVMAVVASAKGISSDYELGRLLIHVIDTATMDDVLRTMVRDAADQIESQYTRGRVLERLYPRGQ